jgi:hypothetical protein
MSDVKQAAARGAEFLRLHEDRERIKNWKRWGPYLSERQWGTVREDYSDTGECWTYFPHDHARSRAYRWGEDGILGITDRECRLCFAVAMWNGNDPIIKERLFGLTGPEGNHGEDVKELYFYLDSTPTHSYMKGLYKYPQREYPYARLVEGNKSRGRNEPEFEITDTGVFEDGRYFDVQVEYAKAAPDDLLIRITVSNRGPEAATIHLLPTLWFRNTWSWGCKHEGCWMKPRIRFGEKKSFLTNHVALQPFEMVMAPSSSGVHPEYLFTENETNFTQIWGGGPPLNRAKDAFDAYLIHRRVEALNPRRFGTKAAAYYPLQIPAHGSAVVRLRLYPELEPPKDPLGQEFEHTFHKRIHEADEFYQRISPARLEADESQVVRQGYAGLLWTKQFYHYIVQDWLDGDPEQPPPPPSRRDGRNRDWTHLYNRDVISMPDKFEYPWYAAWDLAFHMIAFARIDPQFAKEQLLLFLREWYMHPNGQIPAYEFAFSDVNPPVHAWACWRVYKMTGEKGARDRVFLASAFQKLLLNFTWWVNRKDVGGKHIFAGGFLGLDNIGVFDRSKPLPTGGYLEQADGTAWMAFYCTTMLAIALELAEYDPVYEDMASKFFEHFVAIADAMNTLGGTGLWDEQDGFYYDKLFVRGAEVPLRVRSMVGIIPLFAVEVLEQDKIERLEGFKKRTQWFLEYRKDLARHISYLEAEDRPEKAHRLLAIPSRERLERVLRYVFHDDEFLSPYGIRSLSRTHKERPFVMHDDGHEYRVEYEPGESRTGLFGGNSNWRGPIWFPVNYLLIEALERYHHFYGDTLTIELPTGSGQTVTLKQAARDLAARLSRLFMPDAHGRRPSLGADPRWAEDPAFRNLVLFHEYFHGDNGAGLGASHQTGWTALAVRCLEATAKARKKDAPVTTERAMRADSSVSK